MLRQRQLWNYFTHCSVKSQQILHEHLKQAIENVLRTKKSRETVAIARPLSTQIYK